MKILSTFFLIFFTNALVFASENYELFLSTHPQSPGIVTAESFRTSREQKLLSPLFDAMALQKNQNQIESVKQKLDELQIFLRNYNFLNSILVSEKQFPELLDLARKAAKKLELYGKFNLFLQGGSAQDSFTYSYNPNDFDITIQASLLKTLTNDEILSVISHEMGHVKDQALLMQELFKTLLQKDQTFLDDFARCAEQTADRFSVFVLGNANTPMNALSLIHLNLPISKLNTEKLFQQTQNIFVPSQSQLDILNNAQKSHPFYLMRLLDMQNYESSELFQKLNKQISQIDFAKSLDLLKNLAAKKLALEGTEKRYSIETEAIEEPLAALTNRQQFKVQKESIDTQITELQKTILAEFETAPDSLLYSVFIEKIEEDSEDHLKKLLLQHIVDLVKTKVDLEQDPEKKLELSNHLEDLEFYLKITPQAPYITH